MLHSLEHIIGDAPLVFLSPCSTLERLGEIPWLEVVVDTVRFDKRKCPLDLEVPRVIRLGRQGGRNKSVNLDLVVVTKVVNFTLLLCIPERRKGTKKRRRKRTKEDLLAFHPRWTRCPPGA